MKPGFGHRTKELIRLAVSHSFGLHLPPDQSTACTEYAACQMANQKPERVRPSSSGSLCFHFVRQCQWDGGTGLKKEVEIVLTVLNQAAEGAYSVQAFDLVYDRTLRPYYGKIYGRKAYGDVLQLRYTTVRFLRPKYGLTAVITAVIWSTLAARYFMAAVRLLTAV